MADYASVPTVTLLADLRAQEKWLHNYPTGAGRSTVAAVCRARRRELAYRGVPLDEPPKRGNPARLAAGYVTTDLNQEKTLGTVIHAGLDTCHVVTWFQDHGMVREASDEDLQRLPPCALCYD